MVEGGDRGRNKETQANWLVQIQVHEYIQVNSQVWDGLWNGKSARLQSPQLAQYNALTMLLVLYLLVCAHAKELSERQHGAN